MALGELHRAEHQGGTAIGRGADLEEPQRVGHHRRGQHLLCCHLFAIAGVGVLQAMASVLHLDGSEVLFGGTEKLHAPTGVQGEVGRIGRTHQVEAQPIWIVLAVAAHGLEEALGSGVGPDYQGNIAQAGQDLGPSVVDGLGP